MRLANLIFVLVGFVSPLAVWAQSPMPVGAGAMGAAGGSNINPNAAFVSSSAGLASGISNGQNVIPQYYGGGGSGLLSALGNMCTLAGNALMTQSQTDLLNTQRFGNNLADETFKSLDGKWSLPEGANKAAWGGVGAVFNASLSGNCQQKFIDKDGNLGQWGNTVLTYIENHPDPYETRTPRDIHTFCPKFSSFSKEARNRFYTYLFMTMAHPESSCNPTVTGKGILDRKTGRHKRAIGLFQLEPPACARVGIQSTEQELYNSRLNIQCAVALLGSELRCRDTILTPTSKWPCGTYWAPLRSDIEERRRSANAQARNDTKASVMFQQNIRKFAECTTGENTSKNTGSVK